MHFSQLKYGTFGKIVSPFSFPNNDSSQNIELDFGVLKNELAFVPDLICSGRQVHEDRVELICKTQIHCSAQSDIVRRFDNTDALITDMQNVLLLNYTADCLPVFIFDPVQGCIGLVHSGWRGVAKKITNKVCVTMNEVFGSKFENIEVFVGPFIRNCCYELKDEYLDKIKAFQEYKDVISDRDKKKYLDLSRILETDLIEIGIKNDKIRFSDVCTGCNIDKYASHFVEQNERDSFNWNYMCFL